MAATQERHKNFLAQAPASPRTSERGLSGGNLSRHRRQPPFPSLSLAAARGSCPEARAAPKDGGRRDVILQSCVPPSGIGSRRPGLCGAVKLASGSTCCSGGRRSQPCLPRLRHSRRPPLLFPVSCCFGKPAGDLGRHCSSCSAAGFGSLVPGSCASTASSLIPPSCSGSSVGRHWDIGASIASVRQRQGHRSARC